MGSRSSPLAAAAAAIVVPLWTTAAAAAAVNCTNTFTPITASSFVQSMNPGWNLGNTLDATPDEGSWNNSPVEPSTFDDIVAAGFKSVRIPVTYTHHLLSGDDNSSSSEWTLDPTWLARVSDVVDMALERDLYVITNIHHDSWEWADVTAATGNNVTEIEERFVATWQQVAETLACKSEKLALETINEPPAETAEDGAEINRLNELFLQVLAESGGWNDQRVVTLVGGGMDGVKTSQWFEAPEEITNPWALQYHYYSPYDFIFGAWGKTILTEADIATVEADLRAVRGNFTDIPLIIGEFDASPTNCEPAARRKYTDLVTRVAAELDTAVVIWDNGIDHLERETGTWRDPHQIEVLMAAADWDDSTNNSLATFTMDASATTQNSSAYVFHRVGDAVEAQSVSFDLAGNSIQSVTTSDGDELVRGTDYEVSANDGEIVFTAAFLTGVGISADAAAGSKANLTVAFSAGATAGVEVVQWGAPTLTGADSSKAVAGADLAIPVEWAGLEFPAAVRMLRSDGIYLFDDWTQYLGPLQAAYGTYSGQWNWVGDSLILTATTVDAVIAAGVDTVFTFDFFPRQPGNSLNYTLTV